MATSLIIESTDSYDKNKQKSITDINPNASTQELLDFSQTLINLTNNSYVKTTRIDKTELSTNKQDRTISRLSVGVSGGTYVRVDNVLLDQPNIINYPIVNLTSRSLNLYTVSPALNIFPQKTINVTFTPNLQTNSINWSATEPSWSVSFSLNNIETQTINIFVTLPEDELYNSQTISIILNITEG